MTEHYQDISKYLMSFVEFDLSRQVELGDLKEERRQAFSRRFESEVLSQDQVKLKQEFEKQPRRKKRQAKKPLQPEVKQEL